MIDFTTRNITVNGKEYVAQFSGIATALRLQDECYIDGTSIVSYEKTAEFLLEYGLVSPKGMKIDDFGAEYIGKTEKKTIEGTEYVAKFKGILCALRAIDTCYDDNGNLNTAKFANYLFENVIESPKNLTLESFQSTKELSEVIKFAREVMQNKEAMDEYREVTNFVREIVDGNFRREENKTTTKGKNTK